MALALRPALDSLDTVLSLTQGRLVWWSVLLAGTMCLSVRWVTAVVRIQFYSFLIG